MTLEKQDSHSERYGWYVVFVLCVCGVVAYIDRQIINLLVEDIKIDLSVSDTEISLLQGFAFAVFYALVAIPLGRIADSKNRRYLITAGILAWTAAAVACGLAQSYSQLFVARMFVGVGEAVLTPAGFSLLADLFKPQRLARPVSVFTASSFFGSGIALVVGGVIVNQLTAAGGLTLPLIGDVAVWQGAFILGALPGIPVAIWFFFSVREPPRRTTEAIQMDAEAYRHGFVEAIRYLSANRRLFFAVFVGLSLIASAQFALGAWIPAFFIRVHGWTPGDIGAVQGLLFLIGGTLGVISGGWITDALRARGYHDANLRTAAIAAVLAIPFLAAVPAVSDPRMAVALLAPGMYLGTVPFGAGAAVIPTVSPPIFRAQLVALYLLVANLIGQAGGPWGVAFMTDFVFGDDQAIGRSLMVVVPTLLILGAIIATIGWRPLAEKSGASD
ncbi:MAG: spinster family MFS transporter [Woeseiaceae bacterium]